MSENSNTISPIATGTIPRGGGHRECVVLFFEREIMISYTGRVLTNSGSLLEHN